MRLELRSILLNVTEKVEGGEERVKTALQENLFKFKSRIFTHVGKVLIVYFCDLVKSGVKIGRLLGQRRDGGHVRGHFLTVDRSSQADTQQTRGQL